MEFKHKSVLLNECIDHLRMGQRQVSEMGRLEAGDIPMRYAENGFPGMGG